MFLLLFFFFRLSAQLFFTFLSFLLPLRNSQTSGSTSSLHTFYSTDEAEAVSLVLMCSAVKCILQSSLPALSWVLLPVFWPSRSWLTSHVSLSDNARFHIVNAGQRNKNKRTNHTVDYLDHTLNSWCLIFGCFIWWLFWVRNCIAHMASSFSTLEVT